uniref:IC97/Casc1 N-terminal domain-containing protein n=1 Tax=Palpitomonas bilix TaxID=652834 RepID=A0A7S3D973_9EUKA|mmetsp:Transcript_26959/g.69335  ORF Transcript_26959/g.69335 Transcript_26959/m.69335 type:complete len:488 (+) Transcript_26959:114-1577(+)
MPPKAKKGKKGKKSKKQEQLELEKKLEEARLAEQAEQERLERERKEREEQERLRQIELARLREEEKKRIAEEEVEEATFRQSRAALLRIEAAAAKEKEEWTRYLACSNLPNPSSLAEINAYLSLWKESAANDMHTVIEECQQAFQVMRDIRGYVASLPETHSSVDLFENAITRIRTLTSEKIDEMTAKTLTEIEEAKEDPQRSVATENIKFGVWVNLEKNLKTKQINFHALNIHTDLPRNLALNPIALRVMYTSFDPVSEDLQTNHLVVGGVLSVDVINLPPPAKTIKGWVMRPFNESEGFISKLAYPSPSTGGSGEGMAPSLSTPPMRISYALPDHIVSRADNPSVGWWNDEELKWNTEGMSDISFDEESRMLTFHSLHLTNLAVLQERDTDFPYQRWMFRPVGENHTLFLLEGKAFEIEIEVKHGVCHLLRPDIPQLHQLRNKKDGWHPAILLKVCVFAFKCRVLNETLHAGAIEGRDQLASMRC